MISGAERPHLLALAVAGARRDGLGAGALHPAALLNALQVLRRPVTAAHGPARAAGEHLVHLGVVQFDLPPAAHARRHMTKQRAGQLRLHRLDLLRSQAGRHGSDAARDVEADSAS
jgi:hypothetical protein